MITKKSMEHAQISGAQAVLSQYGLEKLSGAPAGMLGTVSQGLGKGFSAATKQFGKGNIVKGFTKGWNAMGAPAQNIVKGIGAGAGAMYLGNQMFGNQNQNQQRRGPYGY
jgi:hypothetical protein